MNKSEKKEEIDPLVEKSAEYFRLAISALSRQGLALSPSNYAVFFIHVSGQDLALSTRLATMMESAEGINQVQCDQLYKEFIDDCGLRGVESIRHSLHSRISQSLHDAQSTLNKNSDYQGKLQSFSASIKNTPEVKGESLLADGMLNMTKDMELHMSSMHGNLLESISELTQLRTQISALRQQASVDSLTGVSNRHALDTSFKQMLTDANNNNQRMSALMVDIDHFKSFNDRYGHLIGDQVLRYVAQVIKNQVKGHDLVGRYGGEEFMVLLPQTLLEGAEALAKQICSAVSQKTLVNKGNEKDYGNVFVSVGVAQSLPGDTPDDLFRRMDKALYQAKSRGRNRVVCSS